MNMLNNKPYCIDIIFNLSNDKKFKFKSYYGYFHHLFAKLYQSTLVICMKYTFKGFNLCLTVFLDPKNLCFDTKMSSLCQLVAEIWRKMKMNATYRRPSLILSIKKIPQGCQLGTRLIVVV